MLRLASSVWMAARMGWLFGDDHSALYPAALMAAMTVNRPGLASSWPVSAGVASAGRAASRRTVSTGRSNWLGLRIVPVYPNIR